MAELVETNDLTAPAQDGWTMDYRIRREDGEELHAEVRCWKKGQVDAERAGNIDALTAIADRKLGGPSRRSGERIVEPRVEARMPG